MPCILTICVVMLVFSTRGNSQTARTTEDNIMIVLLNPWTKEVAFTLHSGMERILTTPSGNFLRTVNFTIGLNEPIMQFSGPRRILEVKMYYDIDGDGVDEEITDTMAVLTRSGKLTLVFLSNGAGNRLPVGWDF